MRNGILESVHDARWLEAVRDGQLGECEVIVSALTEVALWYAYELARSPNTTDITVDGDGFLMIALADDWHIPGWYHYKRRAPSDDAARQLVLEHFGEVVRVPLRAMLSERPVGL